MFGGESLSSGPQKKTGWWQRPRTETPLASNKPGEFDRDLDAVRARFRAQYEKKRQPIREALQRATLSATQEHAAPKQASRVVSNAKTHQDKSPRPVRVNIGNFERKRALTALDTEKDKVHDRLLKAHAERSRRMRSSAERIAEKQKDITPEERIRRVQLLLRAGAYDRNRLGKMPEIVKVPYVTKDKQLETGKHVQEIEVSKKEIQGWLDALQPHELQRLYVIGRKKIDFKFRPSDYPEYEIKPEDGPRTRALKEGKLAEEKRFQSEQKHLADALEAVAIPMIHGVFKSMGRDVNVYLTSPNDDIAGGLDVAIEFKKSDGSVEAFADGSPMRFVVDMTYARMRDKLEKDVARGRVCDEAYAILKGDAQKVPLALSNARAMKLFRTVVEALGGEMSTLTFGENGPLEVPQKHVPRLILGLDWDSAFSSISNWVEKGDDFEEFFKDTGLARRMYHSIQSQLVGLHALISKDPTNLNARYISDILREMNLKTEQSSLQMAHDQSLANIDRLLTVDDAPLKSWQRDRLYKAALAQVRHDTEKGRSARGDVFGAAQSDAEAPKPPESFAEDKPVLERFPSGRISEPEDLKERSFPPEEFQEKKMATRKRRPGPVTEYRKVASDDNVEAVMPRASDIPDNMPAARGESIQPVGLNMTEEARLRRIAEIRRELEEIAQERRIEEMERRIAEAKREKRNTA